MTAFSDQKSSPWPAANFEENGRRNITGCSTGATLYDEHVNDFGAPVFHDIANEIYKRVYLMIENVSMTVLTNFHIRLSCHIKHVFGVRSAADRVLRLGAISESEMNET